MRPLRASGCILGTTWEVPGRPWVALRASWEGLVSLLGRSWSLSGASGAPGGGLGASWGGLLGACWHEMIFDRFLSSFWNDFEAQMDPQRSPKWSSK